MASKSYARSGYNGGALTELEHERLVHAWAPDGLLGVPSDPAFVYAPNSGTREVRIRQNRLAVVRGSQYDSGPTSIPLNLDANSAGSARHDLIVLRLARVDYSITETVVKGVAGMGLPSPVINSDVSDMAVGSVRVDPGDTVTPGSKVTPLGWYLGDDGQILCTPSTRPPHYPGRLITETDTGRILKSDGQQWHTVYEDTGEVALTARAGWDSRGATVRRVNGWTHFRLRFARKNVALSSGTASALCNLPAGYAPTGDEEVVIGRLVSGTTGQMCAATVATSGAVTLVSHGGLTATGWIQMSGRWPARAA